tara:strand:+ start:802 stop:1263 length:462 start_codon:yes stop_codon:yes gene_type:complete
MPDTYTKIRIQLIFAVKGRASLASPKIKEELEKYICCIISSHNCKPLAIYCNPDHTHILIGLHPILSVSEIVKLIKTLSSKWLNQKFYTKTKFNWQSGYAAFSYSKNDVAKIVNYIKNQGEHHKNPSFREEYLIFLNEEGIDYNSKYLFYEVD